MDMLKRFIKEFKNRDYTHFDDFYELTSRKVFFTIVGVVKDQMIAEDLMQDTYMQFLKKIDDVDASQNPIAYLVTIGRNQALNHYTKFKREVPGEEIFETIASDEIIKDDSIDIFSLLNLLDHDEREVIVMHTINGFKFREVAEVMDKPLGTVLWIHKKALEKMKIKLGDEK